MGHLLPTIQKMWSWFLRLLCAFHQCRGTEGGWFPDRDLCRFNGPFLYMQCLPDCCQEDTLCKIHFPALIYKIKLSLLFLFLLLSVFRYVNRAALVTERCTGIIFDEYCCFNRKNTGGKGLISFWIETQIAPARL